MMVWGVPADVKTFWGAARFLGGQMGTGSERSDVPVPFCPGKGTGTCGASPHSRESRAPDVHGAVARSTMASLDGVPVLCGLRTQSRKSRMVFKGHRCYVVIF